MASGGYDYNSYGSYSQDPQFKFLQSQFAGAFGPNYPTFSWEAYQNDPTYRSNIMNAFGKDSSKDPARYAALNAIESYFQQKLFPPSSQIPTIDVAGLYRPLESKIGELAKQQIAANTQTINKQSSTATEQATEGLAGTGLGRSGVAAGTFEGINKGRASAVESMTADVNARAAASQQAVEQQIADLNFKQELMKQGADVGFIQQALDTKNALQMMMFQSLQQIAQQDATSNWWDKYVSPVLQLGGTALGYYLGGPGGGAAASGGGAYIPMGMDQWGTR